MSRWVKFAFVLSFLWWAYLFFTTQIVVVYDAGNYEDAGRLIAHQGFIQFLKTGVEREPLYSLMVALAMRLGELWGVSYYYPIKIIDVCLLFLTMICSWRLMKILSVSDWVAGLILLYMGISPVMATSSMRLWSEIAVFPWVVGAVLWTIKSWKALREMPDDQIRWLEIMGIASMLAGCFLLIMFAKAAAEGVLIFYMWPFYAWIISSWRSGRRLKAKQIALFCFAVLLIFEGVVLGYKFLNYECNGNFAFTVRGESAFYGNTVRRMQPLTPQVLGSAVLSVTNGGECYSFFSKELCDRYSIRYVDDIVAQKIGELHNQGITGNAAAHYFISHTMKMILANPLQEVLFMAIDAQKMFFWEGDVSFVAYPDWLERIFYTPLFYNVVKYTMAILSWLAFVFGVVYLGRSYLKGSKENTETGIAVLWTVNFIFWFSTMYALFLLVNRYAFPIVSLYLVLIGFMLDRLLKCFFK